MADTDKWRVNGAMVSYENAMLYATARGRILGSRVLRDHLDDLLDPGRSDDADHLKWLCTAAIPEIAKHAPT
jgi:hypothetical protein